MADPLELTATEQTLLAEALVAANSMTLRWAVEEDGQIVVRVLGAGAETA